MNAAGAPAPSGEPMNLRERLAAYTAQAREAAETGSAVTFPGTALLELLVGVTEVVSTSHLVYRAGRAAGLRKGAEHTHSLIQVARRQELVARGRDERVAAKAVQDGLVAVTATIIARAQAVARGEEEPVVVEAVAPRGDPGT